jgi:DNA-binding NarL/FixJ family response regulator
MTQGRVTEERRPPVPEPWQVRLTARQAEVLRAVAAGRTYKEVAALLGVSERTVRYHMSEIIDRLHFESRSQVIAYAGEAGLLDRSSRDD